MSLCFNNLVSIDRNFISQYQTVPFDLFLRQNNDSYILYSNSGISVNTLKERNLFQGSSKLYVSQKDYIKEAISITNDISLLLSDKNITVEDRQNVLKNKSWSIIDSLVEDRFNVDNGSLDLVKEMIRECINRIDKDESLSCIGNVASHDYTTFSHQHNVFVYVISLLKRMNIYNESDLIDIGIGALMHDVGKQLIDKRIIQKPDRLTPEEFKVIQGHPLSGEKLARSFGISSVSLNCIKYHHERYDGGGYPCILQPYKIPTYVQVLTICDVYDAITSNRPYAKAEDPFVALKIMKEKMSGHFNMDIFKEFVLMLSNPSRYN